MNERERGSNHPTVQTRSYCGRSDNAVKTLRALDRMVSGTSGRNSVSVSTVELASRKIVSRA